MNRELVESRTDTEHQVNVTAYLKTEFGKFNLFDKSKHSGESSLKKDFTDKYKGVKTCWLASPTGVVEVEIILVVNPGVHYRHVYLDGQERSLSHVRQVMTEYDFRNPDRRLYLTAKEAWDIYLLRCKKAVEHYSALLKVSEQRLREAQRSTPFGCPELDSPRHGETIDFNFTESAAL